jgi:hypothetical protein
MVLQQCPHDPTGAAASERFYGSALSGAHSQHASEARREHAGTGTGSGTGGMVVDGAIASDLKIFGVVLVLRLLVPLAIPRYPLPAVLAAFLLDGVDKAVFQQRTNLYLDFYQSYDKALDVYYLTLAYISTLRNWTNRFGFTVARWLFYYRLVGVVLFELTQSRVLLLLFANTFEYFFVFYEGVRLRWDPLRLSRNGVIGAAAFIWIVIKLPQEYIIHVAQVSATDWIKANVFGVAPTASWGAALAARPLAGGALGAAGVALGVAAWWVLTTWGPPADHRLRFAADPLPADLLTRSARITTAPRPLRLTDPALLEKLALVSLVGVLFAQVYPRVEAGVVAVAAGVAFLIVANAALSTWLVRRGWVWASIWRELAVLAAVNTALILLYAGLLSAGNWSLGVWTALYFALLLTLLVTLYDRYRPIHLARFEHDQ